MQKIGLLGIVVLAIAASLALHTTVDAPTMAAQKACHYLLTIGRWKKNVNKGHELQTMGGKVKRS